MGRQVIQIAALGQGDNSLLSSAVPMVGQTWADCVAGIEVFPDLESNLASMLVMGQFYCSRPHWRFNTAGLPAPVVSAVFRLIAASSVGEPAMRGFVLEPFDQNPTWNAAPVATLGDYQVPAGASYPLVMSFSVPVNLVNTDGLTCFRMREIVHDINGTEPNTVNAVLFRSPAQESPPVLELTVGVPYGDRRSLLGVGT